MELITMLMIVRLVNGSFPDHNVVPVKVFSFTGDKHGRILQAHMNGESLVIRKAEFYDSHSKIDAHLGLFLRYTMSKLQGKTGILDQPEIKSIMDKESYTIDHLKVSEDIISDYV
ncbi:hypothetical protein PISL3812_03263 [Talaromyces islandicus]|uniref:NmrA-like domain-containing protein n=1 Tax=Talaromyces islandicus TaxID=28573 RepID=A0A0U1LUK4_TALIS|nr:hypothetical protein PISL3812_03263 [Talaromyces islandicus]